VEPESAPRVIRYENRGWRFVFGEVEEAVAPDYDDSEWFDVGIPHTFAAPADLGTSFYVGAGTYRHVLDVDAAWRGRRVTLEFGAVFQHARVFVNGVPIAEHKGGYTPFLVDVTDHVATGPNMLVVIVDNLWDPELAPRAGEHSFNGGIYRDVIVHVTEAVRVDWWGTSIVTQELSADHALIKVETEIVNLSATDVDVDVDQVIAFDGAELAVRSARMGVPAGGRRRVAQLFALNSPHPWHFDDPALHSLQTVLTIGGQPVDVVEDEFGVRTVRFTAEEGFFLNGEHVWIDGANAHQDHAGWGDAVTHTAIARDVALIKATGMNFVRGSHYPHHAQFAKECDRQGLMYWSEAPLWGVGGESQEGFWTASAYPTDPQHEAAFERSCIDTLDAMIRVNRNSPSVIAWSVSNEPFFTDPTVFEKTRALVSRMVQHARELDPSRPAAVGGAQRGEFDVLGDLAGYNGDGAALFKDPGVPNLVSEYGSTVEDRPGFYGHRYTDGVENREKWRSGIALWCAFHHQSIINGMGHMGFIDHSRIPLNSWYWYRQDRRGIPAPAPAIDAEPSRLEVTADRTIIGTDGRDDVYISVNLVDDHGRLVDRAPDVRLQVLEGDGRFASGRDVVFTSESGTIAAGRAAAELRAYYAGPITVRATSGALPPVDLHFDAHGPLPWEGQPIALVSGPPSRDGAVAVNERANIAGHRPAFSDSWAPASPPSFATDPTQPLSWRAADSLPGHWVRVDLEGPRHISGIAVHSEYTVSPYDVRVSDDGSAFTEVGYFEGPGVGPLVISDVDRLVRYVEVRFRGEPAGITLVEVFESGGTQ